jgi:hypothetical protein
MDFEEEDTFPSRSTPPSNTRALASTSKNHGNYLDLYPLFAYFVGYISNLNGTACISIVFFFFPASGIRPGSSVFTNDLLDGEEDTFSSRSSSQSTKTRAVASTSKNHDNYLGLYPLFAYFVGYMSNLNGTACISISFFLSRFRHLPWIASSFN